MTIRRFLSKMMAVLPDSLYLKLKYLYVFHRRLNLRHPETYNEKLQWLKLNLRNPLYTKLVDKYEVKGYVAGIIGSEHIIPTLGLWNNAEDIDFDALPDKFVLKCTHDSKSTVICRDKATLDRQAVVRKLSECLKQNYFIYSREYPYRDVPHRIIAEALLEDHGSSDLMDYKVFCFDGTPRFVGVCANRSKNLTFDVFDTSFNRIDVRQVTDVSPVPIEKPSCLNEMLELASRLSAGMPQVRVDFYQVNGRVLFGEYTFFNSGGFEPFFPESYDYQFGKYITVV